jgi:hypothetical protein
MVSDNNIKMANISIQPKSYGASKRAKMISDTKVMSVTEYFCTAVQTTPDVAFCLNVVVSGIFGENVLVFGV